MTLGELKGVLSGAVVLYEENPGRNPEDMGTWFRDLYNGYSGDIPEGLLRMEVGMVHSGTGKRAGPYTDIMLRGGMKA